MLSKFIQIGSKIELYSIETKAAGTQETVPFEKKMYYSKVYDILDEDILEIAVPLEKGRLVPLAVGSVYEIVFYGESGLYQCFTRIVDRYRNGSMHILVAELTSSLQKYQRREYYRLSCLLEMETRPLADEEISALEKGELYDFLRKSSFPSGTCQAGTIVDISGGGLRFVSEKCYEKDSLVYCSFSLVREDGKRSYEAACKVLKVREMEEQKGTFEHRVKYQNLTSGEREEIIKFIFEEERRHRKIERLM